MGKKIYDWPVIAIDYDAGMSWDDISAKYGCGHEAIQKSIKVGRLIQRPKIKKKPRLQPRKVKTKEQNSAYCRAHYQKNMARYKDKAARNGKIRAEKCREIILLRFKGGCVDCGEKDPLVLEFDHRDRKKKEHDISRLIAARGANIPRLKSELQKCDVRCANCHRRKTAIECGSWRTRLVLPDGSAPSYPGPQPSALLLS